MSKFWRFVLISPIMGLLCYVLAFYSQLSELPGNDQIVKGYFPALLFGLWAGISAFFICIYLNRWVSWQQKHAVRFALQSVLLYIVSLIIVVVYAEMFLLSSTDSLTYKQFFLRYHDEFLKTLIISFIGVLVFNLFDFLIYSYNQLREAEVKSAELLNNQLNLQFNALRSQLSPHFLFNSLNTISSLIYSDSEKAEKFIRMFAESYRFIFKENKKALIPLQKELDFVKSYNYLLEVRFHDAYQLKIDLPQKILDTYVPPLSIQMLVENAIKHNQISQTSPLCVEIEADKNYLCVKNNINPLNKQPLSFQIGINNIQKRYAYFTHNDILLDKGDYFKVSLPLLYHLN